MPADADTAEGIAYFCLENVPYHGQLITILYDCDGKHYGMGAGLSVYINGEQAVAPSALGKKLIEIQPPPTPRPLFHPVNVAVNIRESGFPVPTASTNSDPSELYQAIDGRVWFYPNVRNYWSTSGSRAAEDWYALDFGRKISIRSAALYFYADATHHKAPVGYTLQYWTGGEWATVPDMRRTPEAPIGNGLNTADFSPLETSKLRATFRNQEDAATALVEIKVF